MGWGCGWCCAPQSHGIRHILIEPGRPTQNGYIESFNGRFRDECLNEHGFQTLRQARTELANWRRDYNEVRPSQPRSQTFASEPERKIAAEELT